MYVAKGHTTFRNVTINYSNRVVGESFKYLGLHICYRLEQNYYIELFAKEYKNICLIFLNVLDDI